jgi:hypothetical protein
MANHPYISGTGNVTQMIGFLRKNFPATVTSDTVKRFGLAPKNESYLINVLQFLGLIDEEGKRTEKGHAAMTTHDEEAFQKAFENLIKTAYTDLFEIRGDDAWTMSRNELIGYFRSADKTSEVIGTRQAGVFMALRELAGHETIPTAPTTRTRATAGPRTKSAPKKVRVTEQSPVQAAVPEAKAQKSTGEMALTVRIEINLPAEGTQETYDAIFKSIRENLFPS